MSFYAPYLLFALWQWLRGRANSAKALFVGLLACLCYELFTHSSTINNAGIFQSVLFMISFGWACMSDFLNLKRTAIACYALSVFQMIMTIDAFNSPHTYTLMYYAYGYIMIAFNILIISAGLSEDDRDSVVSDSRGRNNVDKKGSEVVR